MPAGRPTAYKPEYCEAVIELGRAGKSKVQMAASFDVSKQTLLNWADTYPEFLDALTRATTLAQDWWETQGQIGLTADKFNGSVWSRSMAARFPEDWREVKGVEANIDANVKASITEVKRTIVDPRDPNS